MPVRKKERRVVKECIVDSVRGRTGVETPASFMRRQWRGAHSSEVESGDEPSVLRPG